MKIRSKKYRNSLGKYIGKDVTVRCSNFSITPLNQDGKMYMILEKPEIVKMFGQHIGKPWYVSHLWVQIPIEQTQYFERYLPLIRKVQISGQVHEYQYKDGTYQAGIKLKNIVVLKYRKDIAKKYNLSPGSMLSHKVLDKILIKENNTLNQ